MENTTRIEARRVYTTYSRRGNCGPSVIRFFAMNEVRNRDNSNQLQPLVYDDHGNNKGFDTFEEAERITRRYESGPCPGCVSARWDDKLGDWDDIEYASSRSGHRGENFGSDL